MSIYLYIYIFIYLYLSISIFLEGIWGHPVILQRTIDCFRVPCWMRYLGGSPAGHRLPEEASYCAQMVTLFVARWETVSRSTPSVQETGCLTWIESKSKQVRDQPLRQVKNSLLVIQDKNNWSGGLERWRRG